MQVLYRLPVRVLRAHQFVHKMVSNNLQMREKLSKSAMVGAIAAEYLLVIRLAARGEFCVICND